MLSAKDAAAKSFIGQAAAANEGVLQLIEERIVGAASGGDTEVVVVFSGNIVTDKNVEAITQVLLDAGYRVTTKKENPKYGSTERRFYISW